MRLRRALSPGFGWFSAHRRCYFFRARVAGSSLDCRDGGGIGEVEGVVVHEQMQAGRVAAAHFEAIDRGERLMDRQKRFERTRSKGDARQLGDGLGCANAVAGDGPHAVADANEFVVPTLEFSRWQRRPGFHCGLDCLDGQLNLAAMVRQGRRDPTVGQQESNSGDAPQQRVGGRQFIPGDPEGLREIGRFTKRGGQSLNPIDNIAHCWCRSG